jgi:predicted DNA-binding transcriptional regulator AlpA
MPMQRLDESLLTVRDVSVLLRVPVSWVYHHTRPQSTDQIPHIRIGKYLRFSAADIAAYLQRCRTPELPFPNDDSEPIR